MDDIVTGITTTLFAVGKLKARIREMRSC